MAEQAASCPQCGTAVLPGARFCGECGSSIAPTTASASARPHTLLGVDSSAVMAAAAAAVAKQAGGKPGKNTGKSTLMQVHEVEPGPAIPLDRTIVQADVAAANHLDAMLNGRGEAERLAAEEAVARAVEMHEPSSPEVPPIPRATILQPLALTASGERAAVELPAESPVEEVEDAEKVEKPGAKASLKSTAGGFGPPPSAANAEAAALASLDADVEIKAAPEEEPAEGSASAAKPKPAPEPAPAPRPKASVATTTPGMVPQPSAAGAKRPVSHTLLGISAEAVNSAAAQAQPQSQPQDRSSSSPRRRDSLPLGITPPPSPPPDAPAAQAAEPARSMPKHTMLGMQMAALPPQPDEPAEPVQARTRPGATLLGMARPLPPSAAAVGAFGGGAQPSFKAGLGRTMLGVPVASLVPPSADQNTVELEPDAYSPPASDEPYAYSPPDSGESDAVGPSRGRALLVIAALALAALAALAYLRWGGKPKTADVVARIVTNESGESLQFDAPHAAPGSKLRFGGQERPLVDGHATFALASDSLRVGDNVVLAEVIGPKGESTSAPRLVLGVSYRIAVDPAALRAEQPSVDVVVTAVPGTKVTLEGEALALDAEGHGKRSFPLEAARGGKGAIDHVVHYRIEPPTGEPVTDELHTRIPMAMMQIDRPGPDMVTDLESVEIAGVVGRDTRVTIDGAAVPVKDGHFAHRMQLPRPGDYKPRVTASSPGKAPVGVTLSIQRVRDLVQAAREFSFDKALTYAKIAANPNGYRGQSIAIEGRIYASDSRAGSSIIQMLARPCPGAQRCSVWVVDPQGGEYASDRWVRVLGVVDGEQQFRSKENEIVTVPKITARFVLPARP